MEKFKHRSYSDRKTGEVRIAEEKVFRGFPNGNVAVFYEHFGLSTVRISPLVNRTKATVARRLHDMDVKLRPVLKKPEDEKRRTENLARVRASRGPQIVAKIHTPDNKARRIAAINKMIETDPTYKRYRKPSES